MRRRRVLLCGSNYGSSYVRSMELAPEAYEIAAVLARGSDRSLRLADKLGVPMVRNVDQVPEGVDLACAALGSDAAPAVLQLLARGIHVLCEHPQRADLVSEALEVGKRSGACFHVNGHYGDLDASQTLIQHARRVATAAPPRFVQLSAADRFLYGALDVLKRALETLGPLAIGAPVQEPPFVRLHGSVGPVGAAFELQGSKRADGSWREESSTEYLICYRISLAFPSGTLTLLSPGGPVIWNTNENLVRDLDRPLWTAPYRAEATNRSLGKQRVAANRKALDALVRNVEEGKVPWTQEPENLLDVSRAWETLGRALA